MKNFIGDVCIVLTVLYKVTIFGTTISYLFDKLPNIPLVIKIGLLISGAVWAMGLSNINVLIKIFEKNGKKDTRTNFKPSKKN